ncbi:MAG: MotA/TolQ/ExbB proton channel family protein [Thiogranum sp.]
MQQTRYSILISLLLALACPCAYAEHPTDLDHLLQQVKQAQVRDAAVRHEREQRFLSEHADREAMLEDLQRRVEQQRTRSEQLKKQFENNEQSLRALQTGLSAKAGNLGELFGTVRQSANDLHALLGDSLVSAEFPGRAQWFDLVSRSRKLPGITELERFWLLMQQEIEESGQVSRFAAEVTGTDGITRSTTVTRIGVFNAISGDRYLRFLPENNRLIELPRQPARSVRDTAAAFSGATTDYATMIIDPTRGGLLGLLVLTPTLMERIQQGGTVGYVIIGIGLLGLLLAVIRMLHLNLTARKVRHQLQQPARPQKDNPLGRVLLAAEGLRGKDIDAIESLLDEAILRETPDLQRGLGLIKLLAAVAPLLGLLGTVTGMILTFQSISLFGTGDPRLMAGGISQALVTTVMGLVTAIPLLFFHTLLASRSRTLIQILDEQSAGVIAAQVGHDD